MIKNSVIKKAAIRKTPYKDNEFIPVYGMYYKYRLIDENTNDTLRFQGQLYIRWSYLQEL